jgi:hypothetical protein
VSGPRSAGRAPTNGGVSPTSGGVRRLVRDGELTTVTWPVGRELPLDQQVAELAALDWYPGPMRDAAIKRTEEGTLGLSEVELPPRTDTAPWSTIETSHTTDGTGNSRQRTAATCFGVPLTWWAARVSIPAPWDPVIGISSGSQRCVAPAQRRCVVQAST